MSTLTPLALIHLSAPKKKKTENIISLDFPSFSWEQKKKVLSNLTNLLSFEADLSDVSLNSFPPFPPTMVASRNSKF